MKRNHLSLLPLCLLFISFGCTDNKKEATLPSENNIDAARNFIRAALDGKFDEARKYMLPDSVNTNYMDVVERARQTMDKTARDGYRTASINILQVSERIKDSVTIVVYSNSFKNDPDTLKVTRWNGQWLVDLKYLYEHIHDTSVHKINTQDTLR